MALSKCIRAQHIKVCTVEMEMEFGKVMGEAAFVDFSSGPEMSWQYTHRSGWMHDAFGAMQMYLLLNRCPFPLKAVFVKFNKF
jgi:hypothetical protein